MYEHQVTIVRKIKLTLLGVTTAGVLFGSACAAIDVPQNLVAGTQSFIKGYTTDLWEAIIPPPDELLGLADDE